MSRRGRSWTPITRSSRRGRPTSGGSTGRPTGPLHGVPVGVKDIIDTADMPTEIGSVLYAGRHARRATRPWSRRCGRRVR